MNEKRLHIMVGGLTGEQVKAIKKVAIDEGKSLSKMVKEFLLSKIREE